MANQAAQSNGAGRLLDIARKAGSGAPMETVNLVTVTEATGIEGDYRGESTRRQVTVLAREDWEAACTELNVNLDWTTRRANLLIEGIPLRETTGQVIRIGDLVLKVTGETKPCDLMEKSQTGLRESLETGWRGGVSCQVIRGGTINIGDPIRLES